MPTKGYKVVFDETKKDNTKLDAWYCECDIFSAEETLLSRCRFCIAWNIVVQWAFEPTDVHASVVLAKCAQKILAQELQRAVPDPGKEFLVDTKPDLSEQEMYAIRQRLQQRTPFEIVIESRIGF